MPGFVVLYLVAYCFHWRQMINCVRLVIDVPIFSCNSDKKIVCGVFSNMSSKILKLKRETISQTILLSSTEPSAHATQKRNQEAKFLLKSDRLIDYSNMSETFNSAKLFLWPINKNTLDKKRYS